MISIVPAIIPNTLEDISHKVMRVKKNVDLVQIDVLDGSMVKGKRTWPYSDWNSFER